MCFGVIKMSEDQVSHILEVNHNICKKSYWQYPIIILPFIIQKDKLIENWAYKEALALF